VRAALVAILTVCVIGCQGEKKPAAPQSDLERLSYSLGVDIGRNIERTLQQREIQVDPQQFMEGLSAVILEEGMLLSDTEVKEVLDAFQKSQQELQEARAQEERDKKAAVGEQNMKAGEAFLEKNKSADGVRVLPSGVQYRVVRAGDGARPTVKDKVKVHYRGRLIDGKEFDSSYSRGEPVVLELNRVIKGWQEVMPMMQVGSKWEVFIPADMGYGARGAGTDIGPNATLIFDIELMSIE
jgi:FKBP-type peptidyl-prolyl cis-trans isomerase FklB